MRPPKHRQSQLLYPLNGIVGTEANVRLLRVLALQGGPFTAGELARRAMLGRTSVYPALRELEHVGMVEHIGTGPQRLVQLRSRHPLSRVIAELFRTEASRLDVLMIALRRLLSTLPHHPMSAWLDERPYDSRNSDTLALYVVAGPEALETVTDYLNTHLAEVERKHDVHIAVHGLTRSELPQVLDTLGAADNGSHLVAGIPPSALLEQSQSVARPSSLASHDEHDARSRKLALAIAAKLKADPGLMARAADRVKRRAKEAGAAERRELAEWTRILSTMSPARLQRFLVEDSERAVRLRQSLPALNLLTPSQRQAVLRSQTDAEVLAAVGRR